MAATNDPRGIASANRAALLLNLHDDDDDEAMDVDEAVPSLPTQQLQHVTTGTGTQQSQISHELPIRIIQPSPFPYHNATDSRFRNALQRIVVNSYDVEAWQAVITEASTCYRSILDKTDSDNYLKLDWVESCYGALLHQFPYAVVHITAIAEILLAQCYQFNARSQQSAAKLNFIFQRHLGVELAGNDEDEIEPGKEGTAIISTSLATKRSMPMCRWVVELWMIYIRKVEQDATFDSAIPLEQRGKHVRTQTTNAYEAAIAAAGAAHNNHVLWKAYLDFCKSWTTDSADYALAHQRMLQMRSVYQRLVTHPMTGLDGLWQEYESFEKQQNEQLAAQLIADFSPRYQHARTMYLERNRVYAVQDLQLERLATPPVVDESDDDYQSKMMEEYHLLKAWKTRCSYERTNPGRLDDVDLKQRIRHVFCEMACVLTRHVEPWHMSSMWEILVAGDRGRAVAVLELGQHHIPDSTLLAYTQAELPGSDPIAVLEKFLQRSPNTLGFVLYQHYARQRQGVESARAVFARARRTLTDPEAVAEKKSTDKTDEATTAIEDRSKATEATQHEKRWVVTNRLDPAVGGGQRPAASVTSPETANGGGKSPNTNPPTAAVPGPITWHLFSAHAAVENRMNRQPDIAARIYELGLRKHASFLTTPHYVKRYSQLLLELGDTMNLRALLSRAVAACQGDDSKKDTMAALWDLTLHFESITGDAVLSEIEQKRREAVVGPDVEDVATGGVAGAGDSALIGAQKSTIAEQLLRAEGYDVSSRIVNGMSRAVDLLGVMGLVGTGDYESSSLSKIKDTAFSGSESDASFTKRLRFQQLVQSGISMDAPLLEGGTGSKLFSARERLHQGGGMAVLSGPAGGTAIMLAIQQCPDWLRPLLLVLPASKLRLPIVAKPPPHLTEMALTQLRQNALPSERPADDFSAKGTKRMISMTTDGNSSDEDNHAYGGGSGYGDAFRSRQRMRMAQNGTAH